MLNLHKLEVFSAVMQSGSFTEAARRMYITQSAVSQHIIDLEHALGTTLFKRRRRGVTPTESAELLYSYTQKALYLLSEAESKITNVDALQDGQVTIGATPTLGIYLVPEWVRIFRQQYQQLAVSLKSDSTTGIVQQVVDQRIDVGFIEGEIDQTLAPSVEVEELTTITLYVVASQSHPIAEQMEITFADLAQLPLVVRPKETKTRLWIEDLYQQQGFDPIISAEFENPESIKQSVSMGSCVTLLPDYALREDELETRFALLRIKGVPLTRTLKAVWNTRYSIKPIAKAFLRLVQDQYAGTASSGVSPG
jgi:DNA-binding transcriptional LysR family regulator